MARGELYGFLGLEVPQHVDVFGTKFFPMWPGGGAGEGKLIEERGSLKGYNSVALVVGMIVVIIVVVVDISLESRYITCRKRCHYRILVFL